MRNTIYDFYRIGGIDPDYKHIWGFANEAEREAFLETHHVKRIEQNTYWRPVDHSIKANFSNSNAPSYENSYTYDYVKVTNRSEETGEQIYYLFIIGRNYINLNLTEIIVNIDYIQTYYFANGVPFWNCSGYCVSTTGLNMYPPRGIGSEYPVTAHQTLWSRNTSTNDAIGFVVYSTIEIGGTIVNGEFVLDYNFADPDNPQIIPFADLAQYNILGAFPYIVNAGSTVNNCRTLKYLNELLNRGGQLGAITGIYAVPSGLLPAFRNDPQSRVIGLYRYSTYLTQTFSIQIPMSGDLFTQYGITVNNPIIKGYDYTKIVVSNMSGEEVEYHYEDFNGQPEFAYTLSLDSGYPVQIMWPVNYKYGRSDVPQMFAMKQTNPPQASLSSDNYAIWQAQNRNSIQASLDASKMTISNAEEVRSKTGGIATALDNLFDSAKEGVSDMLSGMGLSLPEGMGDALTTAGYSGMNSLLSMGFLQSFGLEASYVYDQQVNVAQQALRNVEASFKDQSYLPPSAHGSNAYGDLLLLNQFGFMLMVVAPENAQIATIDLDLDCNGHILKLPGQVSRTRTHFDFWRILDAKILNAPAERPYFVNQMMIKLFSDGIYLWWVLADIDTVKHFGHPYNLLNPAI